MHKYTQFFIKNRGPKEHRKKIKNTTMVEFHPKVSQAEVDKLEAGGHFSDRADYVLVTVQ